MIKTNELMLGNWVEYEVYPNKRAGRKYVVGIIDNNNVYLSTDEDKGKYPDLVKKENLFGIPITEELLEKCGFHIELKLSPCFVLGNISVERFNDNWLIRDTGRGVAIVDFLHELQNAYFMLTKKHLEVVL